MSEPMNQQEQLRWRAEQYVLGALEDEQRIAFERELATAGAPELEALRAAQHFLGELALASPPSLPRPELRERLLARARAEIPVTGSSAESVQPWQKWGAGVGPSLIRHDGGEFEAIGWPGVFVKRLHVDVAQARATLLVRMEPGASYPAHRHGGFEECFVLSGDLHHEQRVMRGGDFERVEGDSRHGKQWTEEGCLLLIHSSLQDKLLA